MQRIKYLSIIFLAGAISLAGSIAVVADDAGDQFDAVWSRTDQAVRTGEVSRSWIWGAELAGAPRSESYVSAPGGQRIVRYFDKARMEIAVAGTTTNDVWNVTNGLLVTEMLSGRVQLGDDTFADFHPASINVAGDLDDPTGPTYASLSLVRGSDPTPAGTVITSTIDRGGSTGTDQRLAQYGVTAETYVSTTDHTVASVFWAFMNEHGLVYEHNTEITGPLFANPFYATGLPLSEAYWTHVRVGGTMKDVLVQAFERRVLTYTPSNPGGWQVETGNVGLQYFTWRYQTIQALCSSTVAQRPSGCAAISSVVGSSTVTTNKSGTSSNSPNTDQSNSISIDQNGSSSGQPTCSKSATSSSSTSNNNSQNVHQSNSSNIEQSGGSLNCTDVNQSNTSN